LLWQKIQNPAEAAVAEETKVVAAPEIRTIASAPLQQKVLLEKEVRKNLPARKVLPAKAKLKKKNSIDFCKIKAGSSSRSLLLFLSKGNLIRFLSLFLL